MIKLVVLLESIMVWGWWVCCCVYVMIKGECDSIVCFEYEFEILVDEVDEI